MANKEVILSVKDLAVHFSTDSGYVQAVRGISFDLYKGETLCIVGESGSGKSVTSKSIMGILSANGRIVNGSIMYEGEDLTKVSEDEFHRIRGHKIGMIFQDPLSSLNPIVRIGKQITEAMLINSSRIKKLYNDKISKELVAYKNAVTERNSAIINAKDRIDFLKSDKKKNAEAYLVAHQGVDASIYEAEQLMGNKMSEVLDQYQPHIDELKDKLLVAKPEEMAAINNEITSLETQKREQLNALKVEFAGQKKQLNLGRSKEKQENSAAVRLMKAEYDKKIKQAKKEYAFIKKEQNAKYAPIIAEKYAIYKAKCKEAKKEVKEYKLQLQKEYFDALAAENKELLAKQQAFASQYEKDLQKAGNDQHLINQYTEDYNLRLDSALETHKNNLASIKEKYISSIKITKKEAKERALKVMEEVGIPYPEKRFKQYPFEFSGGMRQRIVIAIALTADPDILICDEPTTALDVTIQAQILELINSLKKSRNLSCIFITHDLGVVANMADRVAVMYAGKIVEYGLAEEIFYEPKHPYTWALLSSIPDVDSKERLDAIPGTPPNMIYPPKGDAFALRSKYAMKIDFEKEPPFFKVSDTHYAATWLLHPSAPKAVMPEIVSTRIKNSLAAAKKGAK